MEDLLKWLSHKCKKYATVMKWLIGVFGASSILAVFSAQNCYPTAPFTKFLRDMDSKGVKHVLCRQEMLQVKLNDVGASTYRTYIPHQFQNSDKLSKILSRLDIDVSASSMDNYKSVISALLLVLAPLVYIGVMHKLLSSSRSEEDAKHSVTNTSTLHTTSQIRFSDVAEIGSAKSELIHIVDSLKNSSHYARLGAKLPRGVLLHGPSGTGKTMLARAVAGEAGVPFFSSSASEFVELLVGRGAARVRHLFAQAREHAPCVVFIDELDALGKCRGGLQSNDEREQTLNQLLTEMDGFESSERSELGGSPSSLPSYSGKRVLVVAATNRVQVLDPALLRSGRFDLHIPVPLPAQEGRLGILQLHSRMVALGAEPPLLALAQATDGWSGADLALLVNEAAQLAAREQANNVEPRHFDLALQKLKSLRLHNTPLPSQYT